MKNQKTFIRTTIRNQQSDKSFLTLYQLGLIRNSIESDRNHTMAIKQELKVQKNVSDKALKEININFQKVQSQASYFSKRLEEQKTKHNHLSVLVSHYEKLIMQRKVQRYENQQNNVQIDQYVKLQTKAQQLQRQLEPFQLLLNASSYQNRQTMDSVRAERSERAVFSGLFDKIEKQLFSLQFYYHQLVIQRCLAQKVYKQNVQQFHKRERVALKTLEMSRKTGFTQQKSSLQLQKYACPTQQLRKSNNSVSIASRVKTNRKQQQFTKRKNKKCLSGKQELQKIIWQKKVKDLLYDLGIQQKNQMKTQIEGLSVKLDYDYDRIQQYEEEIIKIKQLLNPPKSEEIINENKNLNQKVIKFNQKNLALQQNIKKDKQQIQAFERQIQLIKNILKCQSVDHYSIIRQIDTEILKIAPEYTYKPYRQRKETPEVQKLDIILNTNKVMKTSMYLYTQQQFMKIGRQKLEKEQFKQQQQKLNSRRKRISCIKYNTETLRLKQK